MLTNVPKIDPVESEKSLKDIRDYLIKQKQELEYRLLNLDSDNINEIDGELIQVKNLVVGENIIMGPGAAITWGQVGEKPFETVYDVQGAALDIIKFTYIDENGVWTPNVYANNISTIYGKIQVAQIEDLIVGKNVIMGPNASISWESVQGKPQDIITKANMFWEDVKNIPIDLIYSGDLTWENLKHIPSDLIYMADLVWESLADIPPDLAYMKDLVWEHIKNIPPDLLFSGDLKWDGIIDRPQDLIREADLIWDKITNKPTNLVTLTDLVWANIQGTPDIPLIALNAVKSTYIDSNGIWTPKVYAKNISALNGRMSVAVIEDLVVGQNVLMGSNAKIEWVNVNNKPSNIVYSDSSGKVDWNVIKNGPNLTKIDSSGVYTGTVQAANIIGAFILAENSKVEKTLTINNGSTKGLSLTAPSGKGQVWFANNSSSTGAEIGFGLSGFSGFGMRTFYGSDISIQSGGKLAISSSAAITMSNTSTIDISSTSTTTLKGTTVTLSPSTLNITPTSKLNISASGQLELTSSQTMTIKSSSYAVNISAPNDKIWVTGSTSSSYTHRFGQNNAYVESNGNYLKLYAYSQTNVTNKLAVSGSLTCTGTKPATVRTENYGHRELYAEESDRLYFNTKGVNDTDYTTDGKCQYIIRLDDIFVETIEPNSICPYVVSLTAYSNTAIWVKTIYDKYIIIESELPTTFSYNVQCTRKFYKDYYLQESEWKQNEQEKRLQRRLTHERKISSNL